MKKSVTDAQSKSRIAPRACALPALAAIAALVFAACDDSGVNKGQSDKVDDFISKYGDTFIDSRDNTKYRTIKIGNQTWMAENLNYKTYRSWCYDDEDTNCVAYGRLYTWSAAMTACPDEWRLPTTDEWAELINAAGGEKSAYVKLRSKNGWSVGETTTDEYKFTALPGGFYDSQTVGQTEGGGKFANVMRYGYWWSATEDVRPLFTTDQAYIWQMYHDEAKVVGIDGVKSDGHSVRCIKV